MRNSATEAARTEPDCNLTDELIRNRAKATRRVDGEQMDEPASGAEATSDRMDIDPTNNRTRLGANKKKTGPL